MLKKRMEYCCLSFLLCLLLSGCNVFAYFQQDPFYRDGGGSNYAQIPLIKPYSLIYLNKEHPWEMQLQANPPSKGTYYYYYVHDIRKVAVEKGVIMVYTPYVENVDTTIGQKVLHWFVVVPEENTEAGFENETGFLNDIQGYGIQAPSWSTPDALHEQFTKTWCLDWLPACQ